MKVKLTKLREADNPTHANNIAEGYETTREMPESAFRIPTEGECFWAGAFRTSTVKEIVSEDTFRTHNSIYKWEIIEE